MMSSMASRGSDKRRRNGFDTDRAAAVIQRNVGQIAPVHRVEAGGIDFQRA